MSEGDTTKFKLDPGNPPRMSHNDLARLDAMSDEDVERAALSDPSAQPATDEELQRFNRPPDVKAIRRALGLTQEQFAATFHLSAATVRDWEQTRSQPDQAARTLLRVIEREPQVVKRALETSPQAP